MSDAEHLIENAIMALERYPYEEAERYFMEKPINIMMSKDSGCPLNKEGKLPKKQRRKGKREMEREMYALCAGYIGKRLLDARKLTEEHNAEENSI